METNNRPRVIIGLGNPGSRYDGTRHNIGFEVVDALSRRLVAPAAKSRFDALVTSVSYDQKRLVLLQPMTYMNRSGRSANAVASFYKVNVEEELIVVCDDLSLPLGKIRLRARGSAGGQKGLNDILNALGSQSIPRLRIGIDPAPPRWDAADYVLSRFRKDEIQTIEDCVGRACDALLDWCKDGLSYCMNKYN